MDEIVREARRVRSDLGEEIAVDATPVQSYSDGNKEPRSDPDADWGMHHKANTKGRLRVGFSAISCTSPRTPTTTSPSP